MKSETMTRFFLADRLPCWAASATAPEMSVKSACSRATADLCAAVAAQSHKRRFSCSMLTPLLVDSSAVLMRVCW